MDRRSGPRLHVCVRAGKWCQYSTLYVWWIKGNTVCGSWLGEGWIKGNRPTVCGSWQGVAVTLCTCVCVCMYT